MAEPMKNADDFINRMNACYPRMSKGQRVLYQYVLAHTMEVPGLTAKELGRMAGVSESTVVRFAMTLGYEGYPQFKKAAQTFARANLDPVERLRHHYAGRDAGGILHSILQDDGDAVRFVQESMDPQAFARTVDLLMPAQKLYLIAEGNLVPLGEYFVSGLHILFAHVTPLYNTSDTAALMPLLHIGRGDVLLILGCEGSRQKLVQLAQLAHAREAAVVTFFVNDTLRAFADEDCTGFTGQMDALSGSRIAAYYSVLHAVLTALFLKAPNRVDRDVDMIHKLFLRDV